MRVLSGDRKGRTKGVPRLLYLEVDPSATKFIGALTWKEQGGNLNRGIRMRMAEGFEVIG